jgi:hypothetical protein
MTKEFESGVQNCVVDCGGVQRDQTVYVVSEEGAVDKQVADSVGQWARDRCARVETVWGPKIPKDRAEDIPAEVLNAYAKADVLFSHYPSLKREVLQPHFPGEARVRVPNRARTVTLMSSPWAVFPYLVQRAAAVTIDSISAPGKSWRITSPAGTDVRGIFGSKDSAVAQAYFVEEEGGRARRNFPGGVHSPVMAIATEGIIVADHLAGFKQMSKTTPLALELKEGRVVSVRGGDDEGAMTAAVRRTDGFIDSWHAGVNPMTIVPIARTENPAEWYSYSHCSPTIVHFHVGRSNAPIDVACFNHTTTIDGQRIYDEGRLLIWDHPNVASAIRARNVPGSMLENNAIALP